MIGRVSFSQSIVSYFTLFSSVAVSSYGIREVSKRQNDRGKYYIGVTYHKRVGKFNARCNVLNGRKHIGYYDTELEAFNAYKNFKESYIKSVAEEYKEKIPKRLYEAMIKYEVDIND